MIDVCSTVFPERVGGFSSLQRDLLVFTALALFSRTTKYDDTVWDVSNRICDRYFSETEPSLIAFSVLQYDENSDCGRQPAS